MSVTRLTQKSLFDLVLCIVSLFLVLFAPENYSYEYCLLIHNLFLFTFAYNVYKNRKDGLLTFNLLFSVSLYCTSFIYPVFFYNTSERYFSMFSYDFDESIISYATGVAYMAYCFLQLGLNNKMTISTTKEESTDVSRLHLYKSLNILSAIFAVMLAYFLLNGGLGYFADQFTYNLSDQDIFMGYIVQFITPIAYAMLIIAFLLPSKKNLSFYIAVLLVAFYVVMILSTGSRTIPLAMIIIAIVMYNDKVKRLGIGKLAILGVTFVLVMVLAGALRGSGELISSSSISQNASEVIDEKSGNYFSFANELIICNRNLYYLISSAHNVTYTYGVTLLGSFLGMIPFLRSFVMSVFGVPEYVLNSALYNTFMTSGPNYTKGLGTHAVADIYLCWGIIGVIIIFYLYGYLITKFKNNRANIYSMVVYYMIVSNAVYACRASIFNLNSIIWTLAIIYIVLRFSGKRIKQIRL